MNTANVTAIERMLDIFEAFQTCQRPLSLTELAEVAGIPKSTCHAIVSTLLARGYLYSLTRPRSLYPTKRMYDITYDIFKKDPFIERATPVLERLRDKSGETIILGKRQGNSVIYLQVIEGTHAIRYSAKPGDIKPLHSSAIGKAILGSLGKTELQHWINDCNLPAVTGATITNHEDLLEDIAKGRRAGYFQTRGENVNDVWAVGSYLNVDKETFGIAIAGPKHRIEVSMSEFAQLLLASCGFLSHQLHG